MKNMNQHGVYMGMNGSGKSTLATQEVFGEADRRDCAIVLLDPHPGSLAQRGI